MPQCDIFLDNDFTKEEMKLVLKQKNLDNEIDVQATRKSSVKNGHSEAVFLKILECRQNGNH